MVELTSFIAGLVLIILWVWPNPEPTDPYDDSDNWGQQ
jgi:hypothetical protein